MMIVLLRGRACFAKICRFGLSVLWTCGDAALEFGMNGRNVRVLNSMPIEDSVHVVGMISNIPCS